MQYFIENPVQCIISIVIAIVFIYYTFFYGKSGGGKSNSSNRKGERPEATNKKYRELGGKHRWRDDGTKY